jgi:hypothetical protein
MALTELARRLTRLDETVGESAFRERFAGNDWPETGETMIGVPRLLNLADCLMTAVEDGVPGGFAECGVWRGGACIMAAATFDELGERDRLVWVCDSFQGLPPPTHPEDFGSNLHLQHRLAVEVVDVRTNFERYGLLSDRVRFVEGWFADSLPGPVGDLCVLRCDGDLYSSTWQTLTALYDHVQPGGFVIVDDYGAWRGCRQAVDEFREQQGIGAPLLPIEDGCGAVFWRVDLRAVA